MKKRIIWGIILIICAAAVICFAVVPDFALGFDIPVWKMLIGVLLLYSIINQITKSSPLGKRLSVFTLTALLFLLFEPNIASAAGLKSDFVNNWLILLGGILLDVSIRLLLGEIEFGFDKNSKKNSLSASVIYFDATSTDKHTVKNKLGSTEVFYQNTDAADPAADENLRISNELGNVEVHIPADWEVDCKMENNLGNLEVRENTVFGRKKIIITGRNKLGNTEIISP